MANVEGGRQSGDAGLSSSGRAAASAMSVRWLLAFHSGSLERLESGQ